VIPASERPAAVLLVAAAGRDGERKAMVRGWMIAAVAVIVVLAGLPIAWLGLGILTQHDAAPDPVSARLVLFVVGPVLYPFGIAGMLLAIPFGSFEAMGLCVVAAAALQYPAYGLLLRRPESRRVRFRVILTAHLTVVAVYALVALPIWLLNRGW
jgi:Na+/proline symporter